MAPAVGGVLLRLRLHSPRALHLRLSRLCTFVLLLPLLLPPLHLRSLFPVSLELSLLLRARDIHFSESRADAQHFLRALS